YESGGLWQRCLGRRPGLEVQVQVEAADGTEAGLCAATVRVQPFGKGDSRLRAELGPLLLESVRKSLQAELEPPGGPRWACTQALRVYPVLPGMELGEPLDGWCKDLGLGGLT